MGTPAPCVLSSGIPFTELPKSYIRPLSQRPLLSDVSKSFNVPLIDLSWSQDHLIRQIAHACGSYGFFQVTNHGVSEDVMMGMVNVAREFFKLPVEEKMKLYSDDPMQRVRLSTSFNLKKETVHNWRDFLRLHCYPLDRYTPQWPSNPSSFKDIVSKYCKEIRQLALKLQEAISESLGLEKDHIQKVLGEQGQHMAINYYPPCPQPDLTYGLPAHTDPNALTILLQDGQVPGLQIFNNGQWIAVDPHPNAFVVNIGDQLQAISNGMYKSVLHRAIVNSEKERISIPTFMCPCDEAVITPAKALSASTGTAYRDFTYAEYYEKFWGGNLDRNHCLELFRI